MSDSKMIPSITIHSWLSMAISRSEIQNILIYLAYKTNKPVTFRWYLQDEGYCQNSISVRIATSAGGIYTTKRIDRIKIGGKVYELVEKQVMLEIGVDVPEEKQILDDDNLTLAYIDHNRIIIPIELTAVDNEAARVLLAYIIEQAIKLLDFNMNDKLLKQRKRLTQQFGQAFIKMLKNWIGQREEQLKEGQYKADQAYYTILDFERKKPVIQKELEYLRKLEQIGQPRLFRQQAYALIELQASGQYSSIEVKDDGSITATTAFITIEYDGWQFPLGRYQINIDPKGQINIEALDEHPRAEYPHPHVATDGRPCLGNIAADLPKMIGSMRIAEALQVLYEFLCQYNPDNPYERISHFDPTGRYYDPDDNPCETCDECCSPYCIFECRENEGQYECYDCVEYRTDYCYFECRYNEGRIKPCDDCEDKGTEHCYLNCPYNTDWHLQCPCDDCEFEKCGSECPYFKKLQQLKEQAKNAKAR